MRCIWVPTKQNLNANPPIPNKLAQVLYSWEDLSSEIRTSPSFNRLLFPYQTTILNHLYILAICLRFTLPLYDNAAVWGMIEVRRNENSLSPCPYPCPMCWGHVQMAKERWPSHRNWAWVPLIGAPSHGTQFGAGIFIVGKYLNTWIGILLRSSSRKTVKSVE